MSMFGPMIENGGMFKPMIRPANGFPPGYEEAAEALLACWSFNKTLEGEGPSATTANFTRASESNYPNTLGNYINALNDVPQYGIGLKLEGASTTKTTGLNDGSTAGNVNRASGDGALPAVVSLSAAEAEGVDLSQIQDQITKGKIVGIVELDCEGATGNTRYTFNGSTGNTNQHTISVFGAVTNGLSANFGLGGGLVGSIPVSGLTLARFGSTDITPVGAGNLMLLQVPQGCKAYAVLWNLEESEILTSPIIGAAATRALEDCSVSTAGFPTNDCSFYFNLPRGIRNNGSNQTVIETRIDGNNRFIVQYAPGSGAISVQKVNGGAFQAADIAYAGDGSPIAGIANFRASTGFTVKGSNGSTDSNANNAALNIGATMQFGATNNLLTNPMFAEIAGFAVFNSPDISLEAAQAVCR